MVSNKIHFQVNETKKNQFRYNEVSDKWDGPVSPTVTCAYNLSKSRVFKQCDILNVAREQIFQEELHSGLTSPYQQNQWSPFLGPYNARRLTGVGGHNAIANGAEALKKGVPGPLRSLQDVSATELSNSELSINSSSGFSDSGLPAGVSTGAPYMSIQNNSHASSQRTFWHYLNFFCWYILVHTSICISHFENFWRSLENGWILIPSKVKCRKLKFDWKLYEHNRITKHCFWYLPMLPVFGFSRHFQCFGQREFSPLSELFNFWRNG